MVNSRLTFGQWKPEVVPKQKIIFTEFEKYLPGKEFAELPIRFWLLDWQKKRMPPYFKWHSAMLSNEKCMKQIDENQKKKAVG